MTDENRPPEPEDKPGDPGTEGGSDASQDVPLGAPSPDDDSPAGDTDQHSDAGA